jgi:hypothetical protein
LLAFGPFELDFFHMILLSVKQNKDIYQVCAEFILFQDHEFPFMTLVQLSKTTVHFVYISTQQMKFVFQVKLIFIQAHICYAARLLCSS